MCEVGVTPGGNALAARTGDGRNLAVGLDDRPAGGSTCGPDYGIGAGSVVVGNLIGAWRMGAAAADPPGSVRWMEALSNRNHHS